VIKAAASLFTSGYLLKARSNSSHLCDEDMQLIKGLWMAAKHHAACI
jgi:hypothetical protein